MRRVLFLGRTAAVALIATAVALGATPAAAAGPVRDEVASASLRIEEADGAVIVRVWAVHTTDAGGRNPTPGSAFAQVDKFAPATGRWVTRVFANGPYRAFDVDRRLENARLVASLPGGVDVDLTWAGAGRTSRLLQGGPLFDVVTRRQATVAGSVRVAGVEYARGPMGGLLVNHLRAAG